MNKIAGGVCAAKGFQASGIHCGIRKNKTKKDLALIYSEKRASAAAVYTTNLVKGAPLTVTRENLSDGFVVANQDATLRVVCRVAAVYAHAGKVLNAVQ